MIESESNYLGIGERNWLEKRHERTFWCLELCPIFCFQCWLHRCLPFWRLGLSSYDLCFYCMSIKKWHQQSSANFLLRIVLVKWSRNPNWRDVFSPPWDSIKLFWFYLWLGKTDRVNLFNFPDFQFPDFLLYKLLTCTVLCLYRKTEVCPKA